MLSRFFSFQGQDAKRDRTENARGNVAKGDVAKDSHARQHDDDR